MIYFEGRCQGLLQLTNVLDIASSKIIPDILEQNEDGGKMSLCYYFLAESAENDPCCDWCCGILMAVSACGTTTDNYMMVIASHNNREKK